MKICPICRTMVDYLYQRGYVVDPQEGIITCQIINEGEGRISPRCSGCYDKAIKKAFGGKE